MKAAPSQLCGETLHTLPIIADTPKHRLPRKRSWTPGCSALTTGHRAELVLRHLQYRIERRLRVAVAIEEQGIGRPPANRPVVQPRCLVSRSPERYAVHNITVLPEHSKEIGIALC